MSALLLWMGVSESRAYENENQPLISNNESDFRPYSSMRTKNEKICIIVSSVLILVGIALGTIVIFKCTEPPGPTPYEKLLMEIAEAGDKLVVINFGATWCGECLWINPKVKELSKITPNVIFLDVDIDQNREAAFQYEIAAVPTFKFLKKTKVIDHMIGADIEELKKLVKKYDTGV